jgi:drug/metabolite transporter (DMT)-like permease
MIMAVMDNWYTLAIIALILMGTQSFLYKVSAERNCNTAWTTFSFMATVALLSSVVFFLRSESAPNITFTFVVGILNSSAFLVATITHIEALKRLPSSIVFSIVRLNVVVVVLFSIVYFKDRPTFNQIAGTILAVFVILILTRQPDAEEPSAGQTKGGLILVFVSLFCGSVASISSKFAAMHANPLTFMAISYLFSTLFSIGMRNKLQTEPVQANYKEALAIGLLMGLLNFAGYYAFLKALSLGPLSIVIAIIGLHFVIAILLSVMIYKEKLTLPIIAGISLTILSVILLRH